MPLRTYVLTWSCLLALALALAGCRHLPQPEPTDADAAAPPGTTNAVTPAAAPETNNAATATETGVEAREDPYRQLALLTRAMMIIRRNYVDESKISYQDLMYSALRGMLSGLDPYSQFLEPEGYQELEDDTSGEFGGIGIVVGVKDNALTVIAPMEDTPAFRAGMLAGDKIIEINGEKTEGFSVRDAVKKLRGAEGTRVRLKIARQREVKEFELVRETITVSSIKGTRMLEDGIGYVRITQFSRPTAEKLQAALEKLLAQGLRALVLDLRNNPGGLMPSAIEVSEKFLPPGALIVSTRGRGGVEYQPPARAAGRVHYTDFPMAVLINAGTASAAEIVAGALRDHHRAILVGEVTFGKGSVQTVIRVQDGTALRLTTARYFTPAGRSIAEKGIEPDIYVPVSPEEWQKVLAARARVENPELYVEQGKPSAEPDVVDRQLERARDTLKGILVFRATE